MKYSILLSLLLTMQVKAADAPKSEVVAPTVSASDNLALIKMEVEFLKLQVTQEKLRQQYNALSEKQCKVQGYKLDKVGDDYKCVPSQEQAQKSPQ